MRKLLALLLLLILAGCMGPVPTNYQTYYPTSGRTIILYDANSDSYYPCCEYP